MCMMYVYMYMYMYTYMYSICTCSYPPHTRARIHTTSMPHLLEHLGLSISSLQVLTKASEIPYNLTGTVHHRLYDHTYA